MEQLRLGISLSEDTNEFLSHVLTSLSDEELDQADVKYTMLDSDGITGEPIAIGAVITGGTIVISAIVKLIERKWEIDRQERAMSMVIEGFNKDAKLGQLLTDIENKHSDVSISFGNARGAWEKSNSEGSDTEEV